MLLAGSVSHLRPAHVVSASEGASSEDVSINGAPGPPSPPSSPPSLAKQLLLALEQGPIATDLEQLLEEHPAAPWAGILAQPAREQGDQIRGVDIERILYPGAMLEWSNNMPLLFLMFGNLGSSTPPPTPGRLDTTCLTCPTSEPPTSCEDIENVFAVGGCAAACTGAVERLMKTSLVGLVTEQDCSYLLPANVVSLLLDTGVDPNTQYMGMTPLALAASNAALPIVEALIAHGADVNAPYEIRGADGRRTTVSPLALAAMTASGRSRSPCHGGETVLEQERFYRKWNHKKWYDLYTYRKSEEQEQEEAASCHESALRTMEALAAAGAELLPSDPAQLTPLQAAQTMHMRFTMPGYMTPLKENPLYSLGPYYFVEKVQNTANSSRDVVDLLVRLTASPTPRPAVAKS